MPDFFLARALFLKAPGAGRLCRWLLTPVLLLLLLAGAAQASHIRAGDLQATASPTNLLNYSFVLQLYTDDNSQVEQTDAFICFSDGSSLRVLRQGGRQSLGNGISRNVFLFSHNFPAAGEYIISFQERFRNGTIVNLGANPDQITFFIATSIVIDASLGAIGTVQFRNPPIDNGNVRQVFRHSPGAFLPAVAPATVNSDSLAFRFINPRQSTATSLNTCPTPAPGGPLGGGVDIPGYTSPLNYSVAPRIFSINPSTGNITWNAPSQPGEFNFAFICEQYRRFPDGTNRRVATVVRDMQVRIENSTNEPPVIRRVLDTCVVANSSIRRVILARDTNATDVVTLRGLGTPFSLGATLSTSVGRNPVQRTFEWTPTCRMVTRQPYIVTFRATDSLTRRTLALTDLFDWRIKVVGPAPETVTATAAPDSRQITVRWAPYDCAAPDLNTNVDLADSIRIYRRIDSVGFVPDVCETGVPARLGYTYVGSVPASATSFTDTNRGRRFRRGTTYCYVIYATWPAPGSGESLASQPACVDLAGLLPELTKASVETTDPLTGQVQVGWSQGEGTLIPEIRNSYRLFRQPADNSAPEMLVRERIALTDTTLLDTGLNTRDQQFRYRLEFVTEDLNAPTLVDSAAPATTPRLRGETGGAGVQLTWAYAVPWDNTARRHYIYREINGVFTLIDSVQAGATTGTYTDAFTFGGIPFGREGRYRYRVLTRGDYTIGRREPAYTANFSQIAVIAPKPCPPVLTLAPPDCAAESQNCTGAVPFTNQLTWVPTLTAPCATNIARYRILFRRTEADSVFTRLDSVVAPLTTYAHGGLSSRIGCYQVVAIDSLGQASEPSNTVCQDNCQYFTLPNIITPNADGANDTFQPICASPVRRVTFTVFNRWGRKIFTTDRDPRILWPGTDEAGRRLADGVYFYRAEVEFDLAKPVTQAFKGWVTIGGGTRPASGE